ncbi:sporulation integral membrane protein YlbJ [Ruminiclostridium hungatei]|uniref:Sporulation integral membrane protein YlbJ n=1 Tax=Ruminiclostridium hungatei TaxID=48256 RepID=A0A1V4SET1_RUMHU|nr:sporulation integral membrane protein YlbJ [Ruminiclostridium hungatei]OPX41975.1 sporulation integral membrane protein YlbJ [Ruminiclostridium hungatei]
MNFFWITSLIFLLSTITLSFKKSVSAYMKKSLLPIMAVLFIAALIIYPDTAVSSASKGIKLWLEVVFPSLFPFFVASQLLNKSGIVSLFGIILEPVMRPVFNVPGCGSFALAMGIVSGYPVGASITSDLRKQDMITRIEAERLLTFTNNSGPLFIMGAVAVGMFNQPSLGYLLYICHIAACLSVGLIFRFYKKNNSIKHKAKSQMANKIKIELKKMRNADMNPWTLFGDCIKNSVMLILTIGGFIIFFSVLINIMIKCGLTGTVSRMVPDFIGAGVPGPKVVEGVLCGIFEITTGANLLSSSSSGLILKLCCASLIIGWAGFSVHTQVISIVSSTDISIKPYLAGKALQGIISCLYTCIGYFLFSSRFPKESPVFSNSNGSLQYSWGNIFGNSMQFILYAALIMTAISVVYICITGLVSKKSLF